MLSTAEAHSAWKNWFATMDSYGPCYADSKDIATEIAGNIFDCFIVSPSVRSLADVIDDPEKMNYVFNCICLPDQNCSHTSVTLGDFVDNEMFEMLRQLLCGDQSVRPSVMARSLYAAYEKLSKETDAIYDACAASREDCKSETTKSDD